MQRAFSIRRSTRARRARLTVTDAAEAVVVLPFRMPDRVAFEMVVRHSAWIDRQVRRMSERSRVLAARPPLGEGRHIPLEGVSHRVIVSRQSDGRARSRARLDGELTLVLAMADQDARTPAEVLDAWLRSLARLRIGDQVARRAVEMGLTLPPISIRDQRTRWGSASRRGALNFSWRLVLCPPEVLDYVVVHELCHLRELNHSKRFYRLLDEARPGWRAQAAWLREHGQELHDYRIAG